MRRQEDLSDKHVPLRIWWTLEDQITRDADSVLNWLGRGRALAGAALHRASGADASRGGWRRIAETPAFTRIDPDANWKEYAEHPRVLMPGGKGDYTDWQTNDTPADQRPQPHARGAAAGDGARQPQRDRLLAGVTAGLDQGTPPDRIPDRLAAMIGPRSVRAESQPRPRTGVSEARRRS